jgi:hypothetical protein
MKCVLYIIWAFTLILSSAAAESADAIAADYRSKAAAALEKVNATLEKAIVPLIADLVKAGDTAGADELQSQLKAKQAGEPVAKPHSKAANLFTLYDGARIRALDPLQKDAIRRLDAILAGAYGKKLDTVDAVKNARAEIESARLPATPPLIPLEWTYHGSPTSTANIATVKFHPDGRWEMTEGGGRVINGTWKSNRKGDRVTIQLPDAEWKVTIEGNLATVERPDVGTRYFRVKGAPVGK